MKRDRDILEEVGGRTGFTVPEGYFDSVREKILAELPEYNHEHAPKLSAWQRVKPYLYMAAMFAGIWCMMKMFHMMSSTDLSLDNPPESVALAMADADPTDYFYIPSDDTAAFELESDLSEEYSSIEEFARDFNATSTLNEID